MFNCSQTKFVSIMLVLSVFFMRFFAWPIFCLTHLTFPSNPTSAPLSSHPLRIVQAVRAPCSQTPSHPHQPSGALPPPPPAALTPLQLSSFTVHSNSWSLNALFLNTLNRFVYIKLNKFSLVSLYKTFLVIIKTMNIDNTCQLPNLLTRD